MMKTSKSSEFATQSVKGGVEVGDSSKAGRDRRELDKNKVHSGKVGGGDGKIGKRVQKSSKSKNLSKSKKTVRSDFLTPGTKLAFTELRQAFVKAPIFQYFDLKRHIWIEMDVSGYAIGRILNQLTSDDLDQ